MRKSGSPLVSRRSFALAAAAGGVVGLRFPANAAEFTYKLGLNQPTTHPMAIRSLEAALAIKQKSGGRMEVQVYPNSSLGGDTQMIAQTRLGAIELLTTADAVIANVVPQAGLDSVGFVFTNFKDAWSAMDGAVGNYIRGYIAKAGLYPFAKVWDTGFKQMCNNQHPINSPDDLKGLKFRVAEAPMTVALYKALGASPVTMNLNELYTSLQTKLVDGADLSIGAFQTGKYYEVQKYLAITNHSWTPFAMMANAAAWERLPKNLQALVEGEFNSAAIRERDDIAKLEHVAGCDGARPRGGREPAADRAVPRGAAEVGAVQHLARAVRTASLVGAREVAEPQLLAERIGRRILCSGEENPRHEDRSLSSEVAFRPVSPLFGVEVLGVDLREEQDEEVKRRLRDTWHEKSLLLFRGQSLSEPEMDRAAAIFGEISLEGNYPKYVSNVETAGRLSVDHELLFHMDFSFATPPLRGLVLYGVEVPPPGNGGETLFADAGRAYQRLPPALRERVDKLTIVHSTRAVKDNTFSKIEKTSHHPIAFPHPVTGRTLLFCSPRHFYGVDGLSPEDGQALCDELAGYLSSAEIVHTHVWQPGDFVVWDNMQLQHARKKFNSQYHRHLRRIQIAEPAAVPV